MKNSMLGVAVAVVAIVASPGAQQAPGTGALEVASIRLNTSGSGNNFLNIRLGGRVVAENQTAAQLLLSAYQLQPSQLVGGPEWIYADRYDLTAISSSGVQSREVLSAVLRQLFAERFKLAVHVETRELPVYSLVMAQPDRALGPRLQTSPVGCAHLPGSPAVQGNDPAPGRPRCTVSAGQPTPSTNRIVASGVDMPMLAAVVGRYVDRVVVDKSGLSDWYDAEVEFLSDRAPASAEGVPLVTALQEQLGLKLEPDKAPVAVTVIDAIARPTEN